MNKLLWERLNDGTWADLRNWHATLAQLRAQNPALAINHLEPLVVDNECKLLVFTGITQKAADPKALPLF